MVAARIAPRPRPHPLPLLEVLLRVVQPPRRLLPLRRRRARRIIRRLPRRCHLERRPVHAVVAAPCAPGRRCHLRRLHPLASKALQLRRQLLLHLHAGELLLQPFDLLLQFAGRRLTLGVRLVVRRPGVPGHAAHLLLVERRVAVELDLLARKDAPLQREGALAVAVEEDRHELRDLLHLERRGVGRGRGDPLVVVRTLRDEREVALYDALPDEPLDRLGGDVVAALRRAVVVLEELVHVAHQ